MALRAVRAPEKPCCALCPEDMSGLPLEGTAATCPVRKPAHERCA